MCKIKQIISTTSLTTSMFSTPTKKRSRAAAATSTLVSIQEYATSRSGTAQANNNKRQRLSILTDEFDVPVITDTIASLMSGELDDLDDVQVVARVKDLGFFQGNTINVLSLKTAVQDNLPPKDITTMVMDYLLLDYNNERVNKLIDETYFCDDCPDCGLGDDDLLVTSKYLCFDDDEEKKISDSVVVNNNKIMTPLELVETVNSTGEYKNDIFRKLRAVGVHHGKTMFRHCLYSLNVCPSTPTGIMELCKILAVYNTFPTL